ncbi:MAG: nuclear transport factor 2 family protein [Armatimonadetes bacterium]|nr:nuclear transport factor 2 family protein [Armatimonadota bacterium]MCX7968074.1 nuclear transport factor 2 family protein [Armatimonadota bacterium]MDW8143525.1 hypothetical protein [Armatimonadota bacterium]
MKGERILPAILTATILGALVLWSLLRSNSASTRKNTQPDEVVWALVRSCREGDIQGYLNCFESPLRDRLERLAKEQGEEEFSAYLRQLIAPVKGVAVFEPKEKQGNWEVVVEFTFSDRTERQVFVMRKIKGEWKIVGVETSKPAPVLVPYGTPVKEL